jgi:DNA polymerase-3 subunit delta'
LRPYESEWRTVIFQDAERMNPTAQNHFLKMLEEPPGRTLFILLSEYPRVLLPTIRSRCQMVRFRSLRPETVLELLLREREIPRPLAESIAALAQGRMDRALDLVDSDKRDIVLQIVAQLSEGGDPVALADQFASNLSSQRKQIEAAVSAELSADVESGEEKDKETLKEQRMALTEAAFRRDILDYLFLLETWYRDELVYATTGDEAGILNRDHVDRLREGGHGAPEKKIEAVEQARYYLDRFVNEERVFRDLFFALAAD